LPYLAGGAVLVLAVVGWLVFGPGGESQPPGQTASPPAGAQAVTLQIQPWANITAITNKASGDRVAAECTTSPCLLSLPPGEYHVEATNPALQASGAFDFTVVAGDVRPIVLKLPVLDAEAEARRIIEGR
jgi:hypothetical protein